jgi:hypothetical protein
MQEEMPTYDFSELAQIGHWHKPTDRKNTEMTGYFKVSSTKSGDGISFVTRSVRHNEAIQNGCEVPLIIIILGLRVHSSTRKNSGM